LRGLYGLSKRMKKFITAFLFLITLASFGQTTEKDSVPFTIDLSGSKFKFNSSAFSEAFFYTVDGLGNINDTIFKNMFIITPMPKVENNFNARKAYVQTIIKHYKDKNPSTVFEEKEIQINNDRAYEVCFVDATSNVPVKAYQVILGDDKTTLCFYGMAVNQFNAMTQEFKRVVQTLRVKQ